MAIVKEQRDREPVLDPIERASEAIFGVLMVLSITGSLSVATAGRQEVGEMMLTAIGCNLAWGLTDAVMYLIAAITSKNRQLVLLLRVKEAADPADARSVIADELPDGLAAVVTEDTLDAIRRNLLVTPPPRVTLNARDFLGALGVFALVVLVTFPVVLPFIFFRNAQFAMRLSNGVALAILFGYGYMLGRYSGARPWRYGVAVTTVGVVLVGIIMALGG